MSGVEDPSVKDGGTASVKRPEGQQESPLVRAAGRAGVQPYALAAVILGLILRLIVIFNAPVTEGTDSRFPAYNDELAHLNHVMYSAEQGGTPPQTGSIHDEGAVKRGDFEYYQPPLYYDTAAVLYNLAGGFARSVIPVRLYSLLLWLIALVVISRAAPNPRMRGPLLLAGGLLGATLPSSALINNDAMLALTVAFLYLFSTRAAKAMLSWRDLGLLAWVATAAIYSKLTALLLLPMVILTAIWHTNDVKKALLRAGAVLVAILAFTGPLWIERTMVYGDPLGISVASRGHTGISVWEMLVAVIHSLASPWPELWHSPWVKGSAGLLVLVSLMSLLLAWRLRARMMVHLERSGVAPALLIWGTGTFFILLGWLWYGFAHGQMETRLLLPGAPGLAILVGWPLWTISNPRSENRIGWGLFLILAMPALAWLGM